MFPRTRLSVLRYACICIAAIALTGVLHQHYYLVVSEDRHDLISVPGAASRPSSPGKGKGGGGDDAGDSPDADVAAAGRRVLRAVNLHYPDSDLSGVRHSSSSSSSSVLDRSTTHKDEIPVTPGGVSVLVKSLRQLIMKTKIVNPHPFVTVISPITACLDRDLFLLVYVHSAPENFKRRTIIRNTWGDASQFHDAKLRVIFVMGLTPEVPLLQEALLAESRDYGDILQEDFADSYRNLTYKAVAALKWVSRYCGHAKFILKTDDDLFVNTFSLLRLLQKRVDGGVATETLMCKQWRFMEVQRHGKWKVRYEDHPDEHYPHYCSGMAYIMSPDVARALYEASYRVPFFWVDDVFITGTLSHRLNISHMPIGHLFATITTVSRILQERKSRPDSAMFSHILEADAIVEVYKLWRLLVAIEKDPPTTMDPLLSRVQDGGSTQRQPQPAKYSPSSNYIPSFSAPYFTSLPQTK